MRRSGVVVVQVAVLVDDLDGHRHGLARDRVGRQRGEDVASLLRVLDVHRGGAAAARGDGHVLHHQRMVARRREGDAGSRAARAIDEGDRRREHGGRVIGRELDRARVVDALGADRVDRCNGGDLRRVGRGLGGEGHRERRGLRRAHGDGRGRRVHGPALLSGERVRGVDHRVDGDGRLAGDVTDAVVDGERRAIAGGKGQGNGIAGARAGRRAEDRDLGRVVAAAREERRQEHSEDELLHGAFPNFARRVVRSVSSSF